MRVSSVPTVFGEKIVVCLLDKEMLKLDLMELGFESESLEIVKKNIKRPWGIILATGSTGSEKTNTLYSAISTLNSVGKNIMTAEDPVEFNLPGINQVNIKEEIGLKFATVLRNFLRQDPHTRHYRLRIDKGCAATTNIEGMLHSNHGNGNAYRKSQ